MIPDHLVDKAAAAISRTALFQAHRREDYPPKLLALAALEAVAADIWDDGYDAGLGEDDGGGRLHPNPYDRNENA